tara:strand:- start:34779 stop:36389 length:1611 start_codon:yes stop_codon:yes gene_type:complete
MACKYTGSCLAVGNNPFAGYNCEDSNGLIYFTTVPDASAIAGSSFQNIWWANLESCQLECCPESTTPPSTTTESCYKLGCDENKCKLNTHWDFTTSPTKGDSQPNWQITDTNGAKIKYTAVDSEDCGGVANEKQSGKAVRMFHATEDFSLTVRMLTNHEKRKDHDTASVKLYRVSSCCAGERKEPDVCGCECKKQNNNKWKAYNKVFDSEGNCVSQSELKTDIEYESESKCLCKECGDQDYCVGACCAPGDDPTPCRDDLIRTECEEIGWHFNGAGTSCLIDDGISVCPYVILGACCQPHDFAAPAIGWWKGNYGNENACDWNCEMTEESMCDEHRGQIWHGKNTKCFDAREWENPHVAKCTSCGWVDANDNYSDCNPFPPAQCFEGDLVTAKWAPDGSYRPAKIVGIGHSFDWLVEWSDGAGFSPVHPRNIMKNSVPCACGWETDPEPVGACCYTNMHFQVPWTTCATITEEECKLKGFSFLYSAEQANKWHGYGTICTNTLANVEEWWDNERAKWKGSGNVERECYHWAHRYKD